VNARALGIYHRLCGRTVGDLALAGWLFQEVTEGWSTADRLDCLERIEIIREHLDPPRTTGTAPYGQTHPRDRH
jgi:hypothetical protein